MIVEFFTIIRKIVIESCFWAQHSRGSEEWTEWNDHFMTWEWDENETTTVKFFLLSPFFLFTLVDYVFIHVEPRLKVAKHVVATM